MIYPKIQSTWWLIGGGPIGCELAQAFLMLGIRVSVLEMNKILPRDEAELVGILREHLLKQGLSLFEGIKILEISKQDTKIIIKIEQNGEQKQIMGSHLLVATGRKPNLEYLNLEKASVVYTPRGIGVDSRLRSSNKKIYAIGDAVGPYQFTHMASYHARIVIRNILFKLPAKVDYRVVPWVSYTEPELAHAGLSFEEAQKTDPKVKELTFSFDDNDRAQAEVATMGKIKIIVNRKGVVLGVNILGSHAGELLLPWIDLVSRRKSLKALMDLIVPYPTLSEISKQVSAEFYKPMLFSKKIRRLVKFLGWF